MQAACDAGTPSGGSLCSGNDGKSGRGIQTDMATSGPVNYRDDPEYDGRADAWAGWNLYLDICRGEKA